MDKHNIILALSGNSNYDVTNVMYIHKNWQTSVSKRCAAASSWFGSIRASACNQSFNELHVQFVEASSFFFLTFNTEEYLILTSNHLEYFSVGYHHNEQYRAISAYFFYLPLNLLVNVFDHLAKFWISHLCKTHAIGQLQALKRKKICMGLLLPKWNSDILWLD
ncbi:hypothetical protein T4B_6533 [Trichinella pseudospiralis]|uniref:Uncharacterized protein n=1 Tax=Trichinella pseudospiralis TaxID=6337 RepID=A0A0V1GXT6_TRIPS|nr:hypothetical protein T4B_6533 [Trichinella pseudospiralis]